jgi:broad specificity phosphatase PhoE
VSSRQTSSFRVPEEVSATLAFVRHGESTYVAEGRFQGRQDPPLSALGERQAALVAQRLAERDGGTPLPLPAGPPLAVWHSPLQRAAATARHIAAAQPGVVPLRVSAELTELAQGKWEGLLLAEVKAHYAAELAAWRRRPNEAHAPGGESLPAAARRVRRGLSTVIDALAAAASARAGTSDGAGVAASLERDPVPGYAQSPPARTAAEPWAVIVAHDGISRLALLALLGMPAARFWSMPFNLCGITVVGLHGGVATLRAHNLSEHLAPLADEARAAEEARGERRGAL